MYLFIHLPAGWLLMMVSYCIVAQSAILVAQLEFHNLLSLLRRSTKERSLAEYSPMKISIEV